MPLISCGRDGARRSGGVTPDVEAVLEHTGLAQTVQLPGCHVHAARNGIHLLHVPLQAARHALLRHNLRINTR